MAEIQGKDSGKKKGKQKKINIRVDFTPMVDMNMLLITFFMLATTLNKPQTMELAMPKNDKNMIEEDQNKVKQSNAVTILLGADNKVYYYFGFPDYEDVSKLKETDYSSSGLRKMLLDRNAAIVSNMEELKTKLERLEITEEEFKEQSAEIKSVDNAPVVMIKATNAATYTNLVDVLDEMLICSYSKYAIMDISDVDIFVLKHKYEMMTPENRAESNGVILLKTIASNEKQTDTLTL